MVSGKFSNSNFKLTTRIFPTFELEAFFKCLGLIKQSLVYHPIQNRNAMRAGGFFFLFFIFFLLSVPLLQQQNLKQ